MDTKEMRKLLLDMLPAWNYWVTRPFKQLLDQGISLEMYYCIQTLLYLNRPMTMSELGEYMRIPKQQMTKLINQLVDRSFVERQYDPGDRRIIKIVTTESATEYIEHFLNEDASCFRELLDKLGDEDSKKFSLALQMVLDIFIKLRTDNGNAND